MKGKIIYPDGEEILVDSPPGGIIKVDKGVRIESFQPALLLDLDGHVVLSEEDIERIAERVFERLRGRIIW